jgi:hypothetical protein
MVYTRKDAKAAFTHVLDNVLDRRDGSPLKKALAHEGIEDIFALSTLTETAIDSLMYPDEGNNDALIPLKLADKMLLRCFLHYVLNCSLEGQPIVDQWDKITQEEFDLFRINPKYMVRLTSTAFSLPASLAPNSTTPVSSSSNPYSPAELFKRGIKRDPTLFPTLKDEKFNDNWHRSFANQARAQDVSEVLDPNFVPLTETAKELFIEKQKYVYAVLESKVLTDMGKSIVRDFEDSYDAQQVYKKLTEHHLKSTKAMIESSTILSYITSVRLGSGEWSGSTESFITHWNNQVRLYERQVSTGDHFSDGQKRVMLENAVAPIAELRQVKNNADLEKTKSGKSLTYEEYLSLLLSASAAYDSQFIAKKSKRQVFMHNILDVDEGEDDYGQDYDIDAPVSNILANFMDRQKNSQRKHNATSGVRMQRDKWFNLDAKSKTIWDQLDDKAKSTILGYDLKPSSMGSTNHQGFQKHPSLQRQINMHDISAYDFIQACLHNVEYDPSNDQIENVRSDTIPVTEVVTNEETQDEPESLLINAAKSSGNTKLPPGDIRRVISKASKRYVNQCEYYISAHNQSSPMSLVDRGANGGVAGADVRVIFKTHRHVDIKGIDNHQVTDVPIGTVGGVISTQKGPVIAVMHQYALLGKGSSIHAPCQMESYKNEVNDRSIHVPGGLQRIKTVDGYLIPLCIQSGLARLPIRPYTDQEWNTLPHVFLTSETEWDPSTLDHEISPDEQWQDIIDEHMDLSCTNLFNEYGDYRKRVIVQHASYFQRHEDCLSLEDIIDQCVYHSQNPIECNTVLLCQIHGQDNPSDENDSSANLEPIITPKTINKRAPDYVKLRPFFGWLSPEIIQKTFEHTTQYARIPSGTILKRTFKSPNPALNVTRRNESVACDIVYADTPAIHDGSTSAVIFVGVDTQVTDVYGIKTDRQFVNTLEDNITQRGAPNKLISDRAQVIISNKVVDILRTLCIGSWQSEPHQQQQNPAERRFQTLKTAANRIMDRTGAPPYAWLLCLSYVCFLLNHTYNMSLCGVPLTLLTGSTVDISVLLRFHFWQKVYYKAVDTDFPSGTTEAVGHIVGISEHCGHALTWKILTSDTKTIIFRSLVRPFTFEDSNLRAELLGGEEVLEEVDPIIKSRSSVDGESKQVSTQPQENLDSIPTSQHTNAMFNPDDLVGRTFLLDKEHDGQQFRARILKLIQDHESKLEENPTRIKFLLSINDDQAQEVITYNKLIDYLNKGQDNEVLWKFRRIVSHQGPIKPGHPDYKGSPYNVMIEWETGETTAEPLQLIAADDPVTCAIYAKENNLLDQPGWRRF